MEPDATPCCSPTGPRPGSRLEDGLAHHHDHTRWSRRDFLARLGLASLGLGFGVQGVPVQAFSSAPLLNRLGAVETDRVLVLLQLSGGNDGLNTVVPVTNDIYYRNRPTIAISKDEAFLLDDTTGLHPAMQPGLEALWGDGQMAVIHNVGYERSTRSHFEGTINWATARDQGSAEGTGWTGRYLAEQFPVTTAVDYPLAVRVGNAAAALFLSERGNLGVTFADARQFERFVAQGGYYDADTVPATAYGEALRFVREVTNASFRFVESVQAAAGRAENLYDAWPEGGLARSLSIVARLIRGRLGARVYAVSLGGFDTHSDQGSTEGRHASRLTQIAGAVRAFLADLGADGLDREVLVMTFSEFGRTLDENGSGGTDHGAAAPMLLFGSGLAGGLYGSPSPLTDDALYGGDPRYTTDYRSVYGTVLRDWFGLPEPQTDTLLGGSFASLGFVADRFPVRREPTAPAASFALRPAYPNPFHATTRIAYALPAAGPVRLAVYDVRGRRVATLQDGLQPAGMHAAVFTAEGLPSGVYLIRLEAQGAVQTQTVTLTR